MWDHFTEFLPRHHADLVALIIYLVITLGYYAIFAIGMKYRPKAFLQGRMNVYRHRWIRLIYERRAGILAVQTFRNQLMSASFLASTAILVDIGLLTLLRIPPETASFLYYGDPSDTAAEAWLAVKVVMLIGLYSYNFLSFAVCIRDLNYLSYLSTLYGMEEVDVGESVLSHVDDMLDRVAINSTRGLRGYFFGLPLFFWLLSPYLMIVASVVILMLLFMRDRSFRKLPTKLPEEEETKMNARKHG